MFGRWTFSVRDETSCTRCLKTFVNVTVCPILAKYIRASVQIQVMYFDKYEVCSIRAPVHSRNSLEVCLPLYCVFGYLLSHAFVYYASLRSITEWHGFFLN